MPNFFGAFGGMETERLEDFVGADHFWVAQRGPAPNLANSARRSLAASVDFNSTPN